ncbi:uncharacterized protein LOC133716233 [Rosa rugosa]|uniref:uncharacterized protein LOC133716233 n=1 Tax=Rosa rugosa TaxID=74645 RepID=UPI002B417319|nr:uncharacterized protein LOC133716233 [Rosa rugosa]
MLVKSLTTDDHVTNLAILFTIILLNGMRLNPQKCIFGVEIRKFLGYIISHRGIEVNPEKVQAILDMTSPILRNEVQSLTDRIGALSRFVSRLTDKCAPFFKLLKTQHIEYITWTADHEAAFLGIKAYLAVVPLLSKSIPGEMLYIYLAASATAVSSTLIRRDPDCEYPVYYTGKGYNGAESRYLDIEKVRQKPETSGRLIKWALELGEFDIHYKPQTTIRGQAATNFILELIPTRDAPAQIENPSALSPQPPSTWQLYVDGASNKKTSGAGILLISPDNQIYEYALKFAFKASNNVAEYEALIGGRGLQLAREIPRANNNKADALAKLATTSPSTAYGATKMELQEKPSTSKTGSEIFPVNTTASWMDPVLKYMVDGLTSEDKVEDRRLQLRSARYTILNGKLYNRGHSFPNLKCVTEDEGYVILKDIHGGV